jgi:hypothetical protein
MTHYRAILEILKQLSPSFGFNLIRAENVFSKNKTEPVKTYEKIIKINLAFRIVDEKLFQNRHDATNERTWKYDHDVDDGS